MSTSNLEIVELNPKEIELPMIKDIEYGSFVTGVPSGKGCIYVKIKKKAGTFERCCHNPHGKGLGLKWDPGYCVIMNLSYGTLRQIPGDSRVIPLKPVLHVAKLDPKNFDNVLKDYCKD